MKSIIQEDRECYICRSPFVEEHHVFYGTANRKLSERYGLKLYLCPEHHRGPTGVHFNPKLDEKLKGIAEQRFREKYPYNFRRLFYGDGVEEIDEQYRESRIDSESGRTVGKV